MLVAVAVRTSVDVDEDVAAARAGRASIPTLVAKICKGRGFETGAEDAVVARGLPALPALFRAQVRIEKDGAECSLHPAELIERIVSAADAKKRGPAISFVFRALTSHDRAEVEAALSTIMSLDGGIWWSGEEKPPSPAMEKLLVPAVGPVWRLVRDGQGTLRAEALDAMATLGRLFTAHLSDLEALLDDPSARPDALGAIERLGPAAASLGPALRRRLRSERDGDWTRRYAEVLQKLGSAARDALPDLWAALRDPASRSCGDRAYQIDRLARVVLAVDLDLRASASEGGATALAAALDAAFRASLLCRSSVTDDLDEMLRRLPSRYITATLRARISDGDLSLRYRSRAAETLTMVGASLSPDEEAERRLLVELANPSEDRGTTLAGALARCRRQGGRAAPPAPMSPPRPQLWSSELDPDEAAAFCLAERLCGPGDARYRRAVEICCRYAYGARSTDWCRDAAR